MASYGHQMAHHHGQKHGPPMGALGAPPAGTFSPGTKIQVGGHRVVIQKYLSEGGFAHVYLVKLAKAVDGTDLAVLKRVAVPDKEALRSMRTEVETMKRLKGHRPIVTYIDSHASELRGGGYEVFLLMEYCNGGGLIDFMNTRLQHRLTEPEILNIFSDIAEGVACMHYLKPALLHRDLKVENVLITSRGSAKRFKLCDFGSAAPPRPAPTTVVECRLMDEDVQKHTTLQYRSPEMIDVYRKLPLNEKLDIWALGVLLYKLCYYTTPFEDQGQLAILNASFKYPNHPVFSDRIKKLIGSMLRENMEERPTIFQVLKEACAMQGRDVPVQDIYAGKPRSESRTSEKRPADHKAKAQAVGAVYSPPIQEEQSIPNVVPMRRGRPTHSPGPTKTSQKPDASPRKVTEGDPFAALDSKAPHKAENDELSSRFPTLDQFSLLHDQGGQFKFDSAATSSQPQVPSKISNQKMAEKLADAAFESSRNSTANPSLAPRPHSVTPTVPRQAIASPTLDRPPSTSSAQPTTGLSRAQSIISSNPDLKAISSKTASKYVSTGTMTTDTPPEQPTRDADQGTALPQSGSLRVSSFQPHATHVRQPSLSSRPSLEDGRRGFAADSMLRTNMLPSRPRPASTNFEPSTLEFLREKESSKQQQGRAVRPLSRDAHHKSSPSLNATARANDGIAASNGTDILIDMDDSDSDVPGKQGLRRGSSVRSASGPKTKLAGKFGDAFKRFEGTTTPEATGGVRPPSPQKDTGRRGLTPIAGSVATDGRSDDRLVNLDDDDMTPEMRREVERRKLEEEEQRVAAAQAEYRNRVAGGGPTSRPVPGHKKAGVVSRASAIQSRVQSLLEEEQRPSHAPRTAEGYGKYSDAATAASKMEKSLPVIPRKPVSASRPKLEATTQKVGSIASSGDQSSSTSSAPLAITSRTTGSKPAAPRKPVHLNSLPTGARPPSPVKSRQPSQQERLMAVDLPGQPILEMSAQQRDDYIEDFTKRFPSLSAMELEAAVGRGGGAVRR
ncbi:Serine/threonine-protein kinase ppk30 [Tolypocladium ophioglossoides CBS 100239]|uniref:non-specific serine/threonine protein kinase n=1 Tax=Tolypocladium ophioglossoides (strain CBS 100239) TaxID=1163406 RepID=A0A0L0NEJ8_TOLOC|nr:Serine/threonine-protein kinase ppk30 [Tolypocladium ophioglossoides CBS 100239]